MTDKLTSTVSLNAPEQVANVKTLTEAAAADSNIFQSELLPGIQALLAKLASNALISEDDPLAQLQEASPALDAFVQKLQEAINAAKSQSVQGLLLSQQLAQNQITQEQFKSGISAITLSQSQLTAIVSPILPEQLQQLLLSLSNDLDLKKYIKLIESAVEVTPTKQTDLIESATEVTPAEQTPEIESVFDSSDQVSKETLKILKAQIKEIIASGSSLTSLKETFLASMLEKFSTNNPDLTTEQKKALSSQVSDFINKFLAQIPASVDLTKLSGKSLSKLIKEAMSEANTLKLLKESNSKKHTVDTLPKETSNASPTVPPVQKKETSPHGPGFVNELSKIKGVEPPNNSANLKKEESEFKDEVISFFQNLFKVAAAIAEQNLKASASSLLSLRPQPKIMTGARAVIKINGKQAALCTNVSYDISMDWSEIRGIDELIPNDLAPNVFSVKGSFSIYRVPARSPIAEFMHADMFSGIIWPYTTIEIRDKRTDELLVLVRRCAITSRSESYTHGQLTSTSMSFVGIGFRDEEIPKVLPNKLDGSEDTGLGGLVGAVMSLFS